MKYALLVYGDRSAWEGVSQEEQAAGRAASLPAWYAAFEEIGKADPAWDGKELGDAGAAKVVRIRNGERIVTDGPYADTKEVIGGLFVLDLPDLDEAIRIASIVPAASSGSMEIRPLVER